MTFIDRMNYTNDYDPAKLINQMVKEEKEMNYAHMYQGRRNGKAAIPKFMPEINEIIFNPPATIVKWSDGTKTVVKTDEKDTFDFETGVAMALVKKYFNSRHQFQKKVDIAKITYSNRAGKNG